MRLVPQKVEQWTLVLYLDFINMLLAPLTGDQKLRDLDGFFRGAVIASGAKQSRPSLRPLDCFGAKAPRNDAFMKAPPSGG
jgi:hypothetical protein